MDIRRYGKMLKLRLAFVSLAIFVLVLAGCAGQSGATLPNSTVATAASTVSTQVPAIQTQAPVLATQAASTIGSAQQTVTAVGPTVAAAATAVATAVSGVTGATTTTTTTVTSPATVMVNTNGKFGEILTDAKGMTLYLFTKDTKNTSNCYNQCATAWPPLLTAGAPVAGMGADGSLLGTTTRKDGSTQVTYNGWPVYYWFKDKQPGDATGQGVGGVWFVLNAKGDAVQTPGTTSAAPAAGGSSSAGAAAAGKTVNVAIKNFSFGQPVTVPVGTTVTWTNEDSTAHTVTATDNSFDSGSINPGATFSYTFTKAGTFNYGCTFHPNMKSTVTVTG